MLNLAKYLILLMSLLPVSPFLFHNQVQYSVLDLIGTVIMLTTSPVVMLIEGLMLFWHWNDKVDRGLFICGVLLASVPTLMFFGNLIYEQAHGM